MHEYGLGLPDERCIFVDGVFGSLIQKKEVSAMDPSDGHSAWRFQYSHPVSTVAKTKRVSLLSWLANFIFLSGTLLFAYQLYGWFGHDEWTKYPSIALVKYLPAGYFSFLNKVVFIKGFLLWLLERADVSVLLILMGFFITKFFVDSE